MDYVYVQSLIIRESPIQTIELSTHNMDYPPSADIFAKVGIGDDQSTKFQVPCAAHTSI